MGSLATGRAGESPTASSCGDCRLADRCAAASTDTSGPLRGASLVGASWLYFVVPALLALVGAAVAEGGAVRQLIGGAGGLALGMLAANVAARRLAAFAAREECFEPR